MIQGWGTVAAVAVVASSCATPGGAPWQGAGAGAAASPAPLSPELIERVRRGPARARLHGASVVVPLRGSRELPLVAARIDGRGPFDLLVDLGSNVTLLSGATARASGARLVVERGGRGDIWEVGEVAMGGWVLEDLVIGSYEELDVAGVLGYNALDRTPFTIDYPRMQLRLGAGEGPRNAARAIPFQLVGRMPVVPGSIGGVELGLFLDTGASNWLSMPAGMEASVPLAGPPCRGRDCGTTRPARAACAWRGSATIFASARS